MQRARSLLRFCESGFQLCNFTQCNHSTASLFCSPSDAIAVVGRLLSVTVPGRGGSVSAVVSIAGDASTSSLASLSGVCRLTCLVGHYKTVDKPVVRLCCR